MKQIQQILLFLSTFLFIQHTLKSQSASIYTNPSLHNQQEKCGSDQIHQRLLNNDPVYRQNFEDIQRRVEQEIRNNPSSTGRAPLLTVPVVFHVMHLGEAEGTGTNISHEQILSALASLNDAYRGIAPYNSNGVDMEIEFCLAAQDPSGNPTNGVNRVDASGTSDYAANGLTTTGTNNETTIKALSRWPNTDYYNIWVVSEIDGNNAGGGTQGFAYFPGASAAVDGTVIMHNSLGFDPTAARCFNVKSFTNYNITLIHELGHAFGLFHTFQGDAGGTACPTNTNCNTDGDRVCDTPPHERSGACLTGTNNLCGTLRDNHIHNFMDYSSDDCQTEFTAGQKTRARSFLTSGRADLLTSAGCTPVAPPVSDFTTECASTAVAGCTGSTIQFYDLSTHNPTSWAWTFPGGTPANSTAQNPSVVYNTAGTYAVTLVATNASGAGNTETKTGYITIYESPTAACTPGIQNTGFFGYSFSNVTFNNINNSTPPATNGPQDFSCTQTTCVTEGQTYSLSITVGNSGGQDGFYNCFIDYNDDGVFSAGESILSGSTTAGSGYQTFTQNVVIPTNAVEGDLLRMRVINDQFNLSGPCDNLFTGESEDYGIFISPAATITTQPNPTNACAGANASFSIVATGGTTFQWQENQGSGFVDISNGGVYSGATSATLNLTGVTAPMNGFLYRCIVGNGCDQSITSNNAALTIGGGLTINTQPTNQDGCVGDNETFTINAPAATTFQWQEDQGSGFANITNGGIYSGATSATLTITGINAPMNGFLYRCLVSDGSCNATSNNATLTVNTAPSITTQPTNQDGCIGDNETFTINAPAATSFQWQEDQGSGFANITNGGIYSGATSATLTITGINAPMNGFLYRCIVANGTCNTTSNSATLTVNTTPTITTQPSNQDGCVGDNETFTINAPTATTFQWQEDQGSGFVNITNGGIYSGATSATLTLSGINAPMNGFLYRCVVANGSCNTTSNNATLTINTAAPNITTNLAANTIQCENNNFSLVITATNASSFQWFEFNGTTWSALIDGGIYSGATSPALTFTNPTGINNHQYYCAINSPCGTLNSDTTSLQLIQITRQPISQVGNAGDTVDFIVNSINETCGNGWEINTGTGWNLLTSNAAVYPNGVSGDTLKVIVNSSLDAVWYRRVSCGPTCVKASDSAQVSIILFSNVRGNMYDFDGVDDYIAMDTTPLGASNTQDISYTFEAWVYPDDVATRQVILGNHNYTGTSGTGLDISGGQAQFFKQEGAAIVTGAITPSEWHHIAGTYDTLTNEMRLYINGILVGSTTSTEADAGGIHNIGTHSGDASVALSDFFNGKMDEVRIWKVARTQTEIREAMHRSLDGTEPHLAVYYQFDRDKVVGTNLGVRDALGISHSTAQVNPTAYLPSEVHVGGGISNTQSVTTNGNVIFTGTNLEINFPSTHPNGEVVVTHVLTENPVAAPANAPFETGYWVVNNFGSVNTALAAIPLFRYADGNVTTNLLTEFTLYKRPSRAFGAWPQTFSPATTADNTAGNNHCSFAGINDFSILFPVNNTVLLNNKFLHFEVQPTSNQEVLLSWEIESEKDNRFFDIQRSSDGVHWEKIGSLISLNQPTSYRFLDKNPMNGQNYYRLEITDINDFVSYSNVRTVEFIQDIGYWVYPNPNQGIFNIDFRGLEGAYYTVEVFDAVGRKVHEQTLNHNKTTLNLQQYAAGMYTLKIQVGTQHYYTKIIMRS